ncbi:TolC family protein [candidate division KSB1 bacterium]|nr:TolC family protein [candidate division KSB1 bacterium]NIR71959.1 TolC family protein [candidate division KSB1 bacterium]NIS24957.1 TolC family protein [candidate division KSB1 bacterium]NIT71877.1 TolC family protein [candidate division KSB1 bacterium]NIU25608.1 TolC family protein [candidate division KSB1 bacterium]
MQSRFKRFFLIALFFFAYSGAFGQNGRVISVKEAIEIALENNATLNATREALRASQHGTQKARSNLFPKADLEFGYSRLDPGTVRRGNVFVDVARTLVDTFNAGDPNDIRPGAYDNNFSTVFQVVQPIYNGGANWAAVNLAKSREAGTVHELEDTRQQTILEVKSRYFRTLQAQELLAVSKKSLELSEEHLSSSRKMFEVGMRSRTEVLRWEVQKASNEGALIEARNNLKIAFAALKQIMGLPQEEQFGLAPVAFEPDSLMNSLEDQIHQSVAKHPRLKTVNASVNAQHAGVRAAWSAFQPKVNFIYRLGWEQNNTLALDSFSFWSAGVSVSFPLFHSLGNWSNLQESKAKLNRLEHLQTESKRTLTFEVIRARLNVESAYKRIQIAKKAAEQAEENLRVLNNTFEVGLAANIDVVDAEVIHRRAQTDLINARYDFLIARAQLDRATGQISE